MEKNITIHLREPNTLARYLCPMQRLIVESLKITGKLGRKDFEDVLDEMCSTDGYYDDDDHFIPDKEDSPALRHLDLGEATYVEGNDLPCFGWHTLLESCLLPRGIKTTLDGEEWETGLNDSDSLKKLVLPEGLKTVGGFCCCSNLTDIVLPEGLEEITDRAFCGCEAITHIRIPTSVKYLHGSSFADCHIQTYEVAGGNPYFVVVDGVVFTKDLNTLVAFPSAYPHKEYTVPETTKTIGSGAFLFGKIEKVVLPHSLETIEYEAFDSSSVRVMDIPDNVKKIDGRAFAFCESLTSIKLPKGLSAFPIEMMTSCNHLKTIIIDCDKPPKVEGHLRDNDGRHKCINLLVPPASVAAYKNSPGWNSFNVKEYTKDENR